MDYTEYLRELEEYLDVLPPEIKKAALKYYKNIFEEAGEAGEMGVLLRLGSAYSLAKKIIAEKSDYTDTESYKAMRLDFPDYGFPETFNTPESAETPEQSAQPAEAAPSRDLPAGAVPPRESFVKPQTDFARDLPAGATPLRDMPSGATPLPRVEVRGSGNSRRYETPPKARPAKQSHVIIGVLIAMGVLVTGMIGVFSIFAAFIGNATYYDDSVEYTAMPEVVAEAVYEGAPIAPVAPSVPVAPAFPSVPGAPVSQYIFSGVISDFSVYNVGANVTIIRDGEFKIETDSSIAEPGLFDVDFTDGVLSVSAMPEAGNVTIHIPDNIENNVYISSDSGTVTLQNINAPNLELYGTDASFELIDNTFWNATIIYTTNCNYYGSNNTFSGNSNIDTEQIEY
jgi:hypothetical protein